MEAPAITRQRRPFLAPLWIMAALAVATVGVVYATYRSLAITTVVLVRHAEKELSTIEDPPLAPDGELRAERLAQMFGQTAGIGRLDAIYVSDARRTRQTAAPLAARLRLEPVVVPGKEIEEVAKRATSDHRGGTVLIVGHSNTVPQIVRQVSGLEVPPIADDEFDGIYVVSVPTLGKASVLRLRY